MSDAAGYEIAWLVAQAFEKLGAPYFLGGSMASSLQGPARFTNDIDFVSELKESQVEAFIAALGSDFDVDDVALKEAIRVRRSWNIFHSPTASRIDLFAVGETSFDLEELSRRQRRNIGGGKTIFIKSPEDTVLRKLLWFKDGREVNTQQYRDAVNVLQFQGPTIDQQYLDQWAPRLGIAELLRRARASTGS